MEDGVRVGVRTFEVFALSERLEKAEALSSERSLAVHSDDSDTSSSSSNDEDEDEE